jgi:hypothetical protein
MFFVVQPSEEVNAMSHPRHVLVLFAILGLLAAGVVAQPHTNGWSFSGSVSATSPTPVCLGKIDSQGALTTILSVAQLPANVYPNGAMIDHDDKTYVMALLSKVIAGSLIQVDSNGTILQTIQVLSTPPMSGGGYTQDVTLDQNGDYIVAIGRGGGAPATGLLKVDRSNQVTTVFMGAPFSDPVAVTIDASTGQFVVLDRGSLAVFGIAPDGSAVTTIGASPTTSVRTQIDHDPASGDLFFAGYQSSASFLFRMDALGSVMTLGTGGLMTYGVHLDRASSATPQAILGAASTASGLYVMDLNTNAIATLASLSSVTLQKVFPDRDVSTLRRSPGVWEIALHFAGEAGNGYVVGLSLSGIRPGVLLPDGRRVPLNVDNLTSLSVNSLLGPLFVGGAGTLNAFDRGMAVLDVSSLPVLKGIPVWALALTLDPKAPLGIRTIADPLRIEL